MKKITTLLALMATTTLPAQSGDMPTIPPKPPMPTIEWQNWVFAAVALVTVTAGVFVVSLNDGHAAPKKP